MSNDPANCFDRSCTHCCFEMSSTISGKFWIRFVVCSTRIGTTAKTMPANTPRTPTTTIVIAAHRGMIRSRNDTSGSMPSARNNATPM